MLLWACLLRQTTQRPPAQTLHQHAGYMLDELRRSGEAQALPVRSVEAGEYAIAALIDEIAMGFPDLRPFWSQYQLQAQRFNSNNAGVELFERLHDVRRGPPNVVATYAAVLGLGFQGCYGLPGADRYALQQLRRDLAVQLGVDPDRDWKGGVLRRIRVEEVQNLDLFDIPWFKSVWMGRAIGLTLLLSAAFALLWSYVL
ncbi:MAG: DotU family type IV/VI secretion system protein [Deltaproteobacteria bacterium]|nr:DotU family type IV/VI secretion system protein [Deltaproteobacteria bacterium]